MHFYTVKGCRENKVNHHIYRKPVFSSGHFYLKNKVLEPELQEKKPLSHLLFSWLEGSENTTAFGLNLGNPDFI